MITNIISLYQEYQKKIKTAEFSRNFYAILEMVTKKDKVFLLTNPNFVLLPSQIKSLQFALNDLQQNKPIEYILGWTNFWDFKFIVNHNVLIPRDDTEILIENVLNLYPRNKKLSILDMGTGSGCIGITLAKLYPNSKVLGIDKYKKALKIALKNKEKNSATNYSVKQSNWFSNISQQYDLIISNPPYIAADDPHLTNLSFEPTSALTSKKNGLQDINYLLNSCHYYLKSGGYFLLEHGFEQREPIKQLSLRNKKILYIGTNQDLNNQDRCTIFQKV